MSLIHLIMNRRIKIYGLLTLFIVSVGSSFGQVEDLSLTDAIAKTLEYNYGIRISKSDVEIAGINNNWGNAGRYPTIGFGASSNNTYNFTDTNWTNRLYAGVGLDWTITLAEAKARVGDRVSLQGNLDPAIMLTNPAIIEQQVKQTLASFGKGNGHVFNLGHGITPEVDPHHMTVLTDSVREHSRPWHKD